MLRFVEKSNAAKMEIVHSEEKKIEKKKQMLIDDNEKKENAHAENCLMKKVKIKNEFEEKQGTKKRNKKNLSSAH